MAVLQVLILVLPLVLAMRVVSVLSLMLLLVVFSATSTDAINGSQLYQVAARSQGNSTAITNLQNQVNGIGNRLNDMDKDLRAGIAGATAIAFLQRPNEAGKSMVSAAVGGYRNEQAIAVGYAHNSDNNKWSVKAGVSVNTRKDVNWGGSVGYQW